MNTISQTSMNKYWQYAIWLALFTIFYNFAEGLISIYFGAQDETLTLFGFGVDSFIEVMSGLGILAMVLRIRQNTDTPRSQFERTALRITGTSFYLLAAGLGATSIYNLFTTHKPTTTLPGLVISLISIAVMWALVMGKRKVGHALNSSAILADANCTMVCIYKFLFPVKLLSNQFRNRFCFEISKLWADDKLNTHDGALDVQAMLTQALSKDWEVFIQKPLYDKEQLIEYLGRYIFRIAISNHRIVAVGKDTVTFKYFDNRDEGIEKTMTLSAMEFIRRFLSHVLPDGFVRVRHFGLHNAACRVKLQHARRVLGLPFELPVILKLKFLDWFKKITGSEDDPRICKFCGKGLMLPVREFPPVHGWRLTLISWLEVFRSWKFALA